MTDQTNTINGEVMKAALEHHIGAISGNFVCQIAFLENRIEAQAEIIRQLTEELSESKKPPGEGRPG